MEIKNKTAFTYDTLMEFNRQHQRVIKCVMTVLWAILGGLILLTLLLLGLLLVLDRIVLPNPSTIVMLSLLLILVALRLIITPIQLKRAVRKRADQHSVVDYEFHEESFTETTVSDQSTNHSDNRYTAVQKVTESEHAFYLYIAPNAAHIVSKNGFTEGNENDFRTLLRTVIDPKKLHIQ